MTQRDERKHEHETHRLLKEIVKRLDAFEPTQTAILNRLEAIFQQGVQLMAISQEMKDALSRIDAATTKIGAKLDALAAQITTGMTPAEVASIQSQLTGEADKLEVMAADLANPVPVV